MVGPSMRTRSTSPWAYFEVSAKGWKMVCFQTGPSGSAMIGAMTLTSWAWLADHTRSVWRSSEMSRLPTTTASATL